MTHPYACAFCGAALDPKRADALMGVVDCSGCGRLAQLNAAAVAALNEPSPPTKTINLEAPACARCKKTFTRKMVSPEYGIARCETCGVIGDLGGHYRAAKAQLAVATVAAARRPARVENPGHFLVREVAGGLEISWHDNRPGNVAAAAAILGTVLMLFAAIVSTFPPSLALWLGLGLATTLGGYTVGVAMSRLLLVASKETLTITRRPLRFFRRRISRFDLAQLFVSEELWDDNQGHQRPLWRLSAIHKRSGETLALTPLCDDPVMPRFLEQQLERYLGIKDRPVEGEYRL